MSHIVSRRSFLTLAALSGITISTPVFSLGRCPRRILFVCQFGSVKSPIAREHFRRRAAERGIRVEANARGITPEQHMSSELRLALQKDGINPTADPLLALAPADAASADILVYFDKLPPGLRATDRRDWTSLPSMNADYGAARADLVGRIDRLLDEIAACPAGHLRTSRRT